MKMHPILLTIASVLLSLVVAEALVQKFSPAPEVFDFSTSTRGSSFERSDNPMLGYVMKPNVRNEQADCHDTFPYTNAYGFRDVEWSAEKIIGTKRVLLLGDSVVAGHGVCDLNDTIARKLDARLDGVEVLNFGIGGYCTRGEVELLKERGIALNPDAVVLVFVNNDYINSNGKILKSFTSPPPVLIRWLFLNSDLARLALLRLDLYGLRSSLDAPSLEQNRAAIGDNNIETGMSLLSELSKQHNFKVLVALWPFFQDSGIREPTRSPLEDASSPLLIEELATRYGFSSIRLAPSFRADFAIRRTTHKSKSSIASPRWMYTIKDGTHPSPLGAELAANFLEAPVQRLIR